MKRVLLAFLLLLFMLPALQAKFQWLEEPGLAGAYVEAAYPEFSLDALVDVSYQPELEHYLEGQIGFRTWLIQLRNQLSFSLMRVARSSDLVIGRDDVLFQPRVINSYLGVDYLGDDEVRYRIQRMRVVQQDLAARGIPFLFVMAPNKARYEPEMLPFTIAKSAKGRSNYDAFVSEMQANGINLLDFNKLFLQWKDTSSYPLFPKGGTHWSGYAIALAADTLFRRMEQLGGFDLPDFHQQGPLEVLHGSARMTDSDSSDPLNLIFPYHHSDLAYPNVVFDSLRSGQQRPNLFLSGDSFNWGLMHFYPHYRVLFAPESRFRSILGAVSNYAGEDSGASSFPQQVEGRQFVLIVETEHNFMYDDFINQFYELYHPLTEADNNRIKAIEQDMLRTPGVSDSLWAQASRQNTSPEELLHYKARSLYDHTERINAATSATAK